MNIARSGWFRGLILFLCGLCCGLVWAMIVRRPADKVSIPGLGVPFSRMVDAFADSGRPLVEVRDAGTEWHPMSNAWSKGEDVTVCISGPRNDPWNADCYLYEMDDGAAWAMGLRFLRTVSPDWNDSGEWLRKALSHANGDVAVAIDEFSGGVRVSVERRRDHYRIHAEPDGDALQSARWRYDRP